MSQNLAVGALTLTLSRECGFGIIGKGFRYVFKKVVVILGILLAGSLQADGHLPDEAAMLKKQSPLSRLSIRLNQKSLHRF